MVSLFAEAILPSVGSLSEARYQRAETLILSQGLPLQRVGHAQDLGTQQDLSQQVFDGHVVYIPALSFFFFLPQPLII